MKLKPIDYLPDARREIADAFDWYEWNEPGLGSRFQLALSQIEKFVQQFPLLGTPGRYGTRKRRLPIFPYNLIYSVETKTILVIAIAHFSRRPDYWVERLG